MVLSSVFGLGDSIHAWCQSTSGTVQVFGRRQERGARHAQLTGVQKSAKAGSRGKLGPGWAAALWGFDVSDDLDGGRNTARKRPGCVDRRGGEAAMAIPASARSASERGSRDAHSRPES